MRGTKVDPHTVETATYGLVLPGHHLRKPRDERRIISTHAGGFVMYHTCMERIHEMRCY